MTPTDLQDLQAVRAAAERIDSDDYGDCDHDSLVIADYILATIPPDCQAAITAEWLREAWGVEDEYYEGQHYYWLTVGIGDCCLNVELDGGLRVYLYDAGSERVVTELPHITTRGHYSNLATALGIQPRGITPKEGE